MAALELSVRNASAVASNFFALADALKEELRAHVVDYGEQTQALAQFFAPVDTGFLRDHILLHVSEGGYVFEVGADASDYFEAGHGSFYAPFQEWGTRNHPAQPFLAPAYKETRKPFEQGVRDILRRGVQNFNRGARR